MALAHVPGAAWCATDTYLPLATGNFWQYRTPGGLEDSQLVIGPVTFEGIETIAVEFDPNHGNAGLRNYWTEAPDGDLVFWGFYRWFDNFGVRYDPPIPFLDAPLEVGRTWQATTTPRILPEQQDEPSFTLYFTVDEHGALTVPAGSFDAWAIRYGGAPARHPSAISRVEFDVMGRRVSTAAAAGSAPDWWSLGIGRVTQVVGSDRYELVSFDFPTPVSAVTWGRIKRLYR
ncbi:MAG TPA: hypothetical protein VEY91_04205 [Candidatus Limnocylindria bacterium]|nr:hypothetical protein [Candidatus Limnocylindria bacterium]